MKYVRYSTERLLKLNHIVWHDTILICVSTLEHNLFKLCTHDFSGVSIFTKGRLHAQSLATQRCLCIKHYTYVLNKTISFQPHQMLVSILFNYLQSFCVAESWTGDNLIRKAAQEKLYFLHIHITILVFFHPVHKSPWKFWQAIFVLC